MQLILQSGDIIAVNPSATVIRPLNAKQNDRFDPKKNEWESDRAWLFARLGTLIWNQSRMIADTITGLS